MYRDLDEATGATPETAKLVVNGLARNSYLGFSSALSADGNTAILGAYGVNGSAGAAYVYGGLPLEKAEEPLTPTGVLVPLVAEANAQFGYSVATAGGRYLVGANTATVEIADVQHPRAGAAYVFNGTTQKTKLTAHASDVAASALFGSAVAMSGNTAIVGAHQAVTLARHP